MVRWELRRRVAAGRLGERSRWTPEISGNRGTFVQVKTLHLLNVDNRGIVRQDEIDRLETIFLTKMIFFEIALPSALLH